MTLLAVIAVPASAQSRLRATAPVPLLKEPNGLRIGALVAGRSYPVGKTSGTYIEATIDGWIPASAALPTTRDGFDLAITTGGGETVRSAPKGAVAARVQEGTLLSKVATQGTWIRVRRTGYVLRASLAAETAAAPAPNPPPAKPATERVAPSPVVSPPPAPAPAPASVPTNTPAGQLPTPARDTTRTKPDARVPETVSGEATLRAGSTLAAAPDGPPLATLGVGTDAQVLERNRDWVKVRVEGWVRAGDITAEATTGPRITGAMVREQPDKYVGQTVGWRLQVLAVQEADALRPEMPKGQPYLLTRGPLPESGFVYVMITKEQAAEFKRLAPLDEVAVEAVIRAGRTKYLPIPVLELVKLAGK